jgi:hypothetical protein
MWFELEQEGIVLRVILGNFRILSCKGLDAIQILPEGEGDEMRHLTLCPLQNVDADISLDGSIIGNRASAQKIAIGLCFRGLALGRATVERSSLRLCVELG